MGNGIRIRSGSEETGEKKRPLAALLFLYAGVCGTMSFLHSLEGVSFSGWVVYVIAAVLCGVIWYTLWQKESFPPACPCIRSDLPDGCIPHRGHIQGAGGTYRGMYHRWR